jgi:predicted permease
MSLASRITTWWKAMTRPSQLDSEIQDELAFHIENYAEDLMRGGLSREEAMRRARVELGGIAGQRENCRAAWGTRMWDELHTDLRYAVRMLTKRPGFTVIAVGSLALGIGINTVIFTFAKHVLLDRLDVPHPEQLRLLWWTQSHKGVIHNMWGYFEDSDAANTSTSFSYPVYEELRKQEGGLQELFAFKPTGHMAASIDGRAEVVDAQMVSGNYYQALGIRPALGRPIEEADDRAPGSGQVVILSDAFWTRQFDRSPTVLGKTISLNFVPFTIVGVNPPGFTGAYSTQFTPDVFFPLSMQPIAVPMGGKSLLSETQMWWVLVMGRVKRGVTGQTAGAELGVAFEQAVRATMVTKKGEDLPRLQVLDGSRGQNDSGREFAKPVTVLMSLAGIVLLLACANIANLLLARSGARQREMSVRLALGAGRGRIMRQMFTESLLLSLMGGAAGLFIGYLSHNAIPKLISSSWKPQAFTSAIDGQIFAFTAAISVVTGLLFGLAPAWQATHTNIGSGLKDNAQTTTGRRKGLAGKALVILQVSLSMLLLVGAGLFLRTLINLGHVHLGFRPDHLLLFDIEPPATHYPAPKNIALYRRLEERLATVPGVDSVTLSKVPLIAHNASIDKFIPTGTGPSQDQDRIIPNNVVSDRFFHTMGIPITAGRNFDAGDTETSAKVAIINQRLAREFFPGFDPVGRTFTTDGKDQIQIVGICGDAKYDSLRKDAPATYYLLYRQQDGEKAQYGMTYEISTRMKTESITPSIRAAVRSVDRDVPMLNVRTQIEQIDDTVQQERIFACLTAGFGVLALILACIGIYGIMSYTVALRTNEIGIRMALGAQVGQVLRMVLSESSWLTILGVVLGLATALGLGRLIRTMLYGLKAYDPVTLAGAGMLLILVGLAASLVPARRAACIDPMQALRHE